MVQGPSAHEQEGYNALDPHFHHLLGPRFRSRLCHSSVSQEAILSSADKNLTKDSSRTYRVGTVSGLVAAICILQFSYTFPFGLGLAWLVQRDAMAGEPEFDPATKQIQRQDTWRNPSRWVRGFMTGTIDLNPLTVPATADPAIEQAQRRQFKIPALPVKIFLLGCTLASFATAALGMYGSGLSIGDTFAKGGASGTSFGCKR